MQRYFSEVDLRLKYSLIASFSQRAKNFIFFCLRRQIDVAETERERDEMKREGAETKTMKNVKLPQRSRSQVVRGRLRLSRRSNPAQLILMSQPIDGKREREKNLVVASIIFFSLTLYAHKCFYSRFLFTVPNVIFYPQ